MKATLLLIVFALALPLTAFADGITLTNRFGSIAISNAGITSMHSELMTFNGIAASHGHSLGAVTFSTGALISGSLAAGGTFSSVGSTFVVTGRANGVPKGTIFTGAFTGPIMWTLVSNHGTLTYTLSGTVSGMLYTGRTVSATVTETIFTTSQQLNKGVGHIGGGTIGFATPEPGTLGMLGTGLAAIAGLFKFKFFRAEQHPL
ncbi:MAG TPA: PEP-CTERM sorting domain-containing protein [Terriglobales bacterium]|nr:PEP-CTERM sorting domain-containing protein [Terriglobales bacterium]